MEPAFRAGSDLRKSQSDVASMGELESVKHGVEKDTQPPLSSNNDSLYRDFETQILNKSLQSIFSQELGKDDEEADHVGNMGTKSESTTSSQFQNSEKSLEPKNVDESAESVTITQSQSPNRSFTPVANPNLPKPKSSQRSQRKARKQVGASALDDIIGPVSEVTAAARKLKQKPPPTSTPLRKTSAASSSNALQNDQEVNRPPVSINETKDSGFPTEILTVERGARPLGGVSDTSALLNSSRLTTDTTLSASQSLKILVQWKSRTLLIPVSR